MKKILLHVVAVLLLVLLPACTSVQVTPVPADPNIGTVSIKLNPKVKVSDFVDVMQQAMTERGIHSEVVAADHTPQESEYSISYNALRSWDFVPFLSDADVFVYQGKQLVGKAKYHHNGGSASLAPTKWYGTQKKMLPVYDELFQNFVPAASKPTPDSNLSKEK